MSPFLRRASQLSRATDMGVVDTDAEHLESLTKPAQSVFTACLCLVQ